MSRTLTWSNLIWRLALANLQVCRFCVLLPNGCVPSSINNNKYLQYHTPCRKLKINMHKYICATTTVPLLSLGRSGSDPESDRKCSSASYTDFRFIQWLLGHTAKKSDLAQYFKTISNNYIFDNTVFKKYCMLCQRLQAAALTSKWTAPSFPYEIHT